RDARGEDARFISPGSLWADSDHVFVSDQYAIRRILRATGDVTTIAATQLPADSVAFAGLVWGNGRYLYNAKGTAIYRIDIETGVSVPFAGSASSADLVDGIGEAARFRGPYALSGDDQ